MKRSRGRPALPIPLPLWLVQCLPEWWRVRRAVRLLQHLEEVDKGWPPLPYQLPPPPKPPRWQG